MHNTERDNLQVGQETCEVGQETCEVGQETCEVKLLQSLQQLKRSVHKTNEDASPAIQFDVAWCGYNDLRSKSPFSLL